MTGLVASPDNIPPENSGGPRSLARQMVEQAVQNILQNRRGFLAAAEEKETPLYVFDPLALENSYYRFKVAFESELDDFQLFYALKSNSHPLLIHKLVELGAGLDVSSGLELVAGLAAGCKKMIFSGPGKTNEELRLAARQGGRVIVLMDSFGELERLQAVSREMGGAIKAGVRLSAASSGPWRKFGIPLSELGELWRRSLAKPGVRLCGLQFHTSWNLGPEAQLAFIRELGGVLAQQDAGLLQALEFIDIGGGFWPEKGEWLQGGNIRDGSVFPAPRWNPAKPISFFAAEIGRAFKEHIFPLLSCGVLAEPGRWLCDGAMHILVKVIDKKAPDLVITDGGIHLVGWERFLSDFAPIINLSRPSLRETPCLVCGSLCTPDDIWGHGFFGDGMEQGDLLLIPDQGAYTYSLRQNFIKPAAKTAVLVRDAG